MRYILCITHCMRYGMPLSTDIIEVLRLELRRGTLILAVLGCLRTEKYGYTLKTELGETGNGQRRAVIATYAQFIFGRPRESPLLTVSKPGSFRPGIGTKNTKEFPPMRRNAAALLLAGASTLCLAACSGSEPAAKLVGAQVDNYMLVDQTGMGNILRYDTHTPAVVLASYVNGDEASRATAKAGMRMSSRLAPRTSSMARNGTP